MPTVHIHMEPRDEESKARIAREVSAAVAEGTNNSLSGVTIIFHEHPAAQWAAGLTYLPRVERASKAEPALPRFATVHAVTIEDEGAFTKLRNEVVNPVLARQAGFVSTLLLCLQEPKNSYLSINRWMSEDAWSAWSKTEEDRSTTRAMLEIAKRWDPAPFGPHARIVHQRFGARGGERL